MSSVKEKVDVAFLMLSILLLLVLLLLFLLLPTERWVFAWEMSDW